MKFLYPTQLKNTIADLEHQDQLNQEAITRINQYLYRSYLPLVAFSSLLLLGGLFVTSISPERGIIVAILSVCFSVMVHFDNMYILKNLVQIYTFGEERPGKIVGFSGSRAMGGPHWRVYFTLDGDPNEQIKTPCLPRLFIQKDVREGMTVPVLVLRRGPINHMPKLEKLNATFNLRK